MDPQRDQQKRLLIAILLSSLVMLVWFALTKKETPPPQGESQAPTQKKEQEKPGDKVEENGGLVKETKPPISSIPEKTVVLKTPAQELFFSNLGGGISQAIIRNGGKWPEYKFSSREHNSNGTYSPVDVAPVRKGMAIPGSTEIKGELNHPFRATYQVEQAENRVTFRSQGEDVNVEKLYRLSPNGYELRLEVRVTNQASEARRASLVVAYPVWIDPAKQTKRGGFLSFLAPGSEASQAICRHNDSNSTGEEKPQSFSGPVQFAGFDQRYFMGVVFPRFSSPSSCWLAQTEDGVREARVETNLGVLEPGQTATREFGLYLGPKAHDELKRVSLANSIGAGLTTIGEEPETGSFAMVDPELTDAIDFGWFAVIGRILLEILKVFQGFVVNWGIAIVLLTVLVKLLLYPLSHKQMQGMEAMRRLQPKMDELQKKYGKDREKLNMERMKLFQENKVNPLGGCLPLIIQMPVWFALYQTLLSSFELYHEPFIRFWISDLTLRDPYFVLPIVMGITMFITNKMQPLMGDPAQAKMMLYFMPVFLTVIMLNVPAGLALYIFTNNILTIIQQKWLRRKFKVAVPKPALKKG